MQKQKGKLRPQKLTIKRLFTAGGVDPLRGFTWSKRTASITDATGKTIFEQADVEAPTHWSDTAVNVVTSKYFRGIQGTKDREWSIKGLVNRVVNTITTWGIQQGYFDIFYASNFADELTYIILNQMGTFNSPVWFNVGIEPKPQCSACFILSVEDDMQSILEWYRQEGMIFKHGSGAGINISKIRGKNEPLKSGGRASGPLSFMKAADASAGVIKSGGATRRAAKMVVMDVDHPDILDFINCKMLEELKAHALIEAGYDSSLDGEAYSTVAFQNANNSVRVTDDFMKCVVNNDMWHLVPRTFKNSAVVNLPSSISASSVFRAIADAAWHCGDPGLQFDTTINDWHTCPKSGRINASNPCSEYMHLDNSACNLASINLLKFLMPDGDFNVTAFKHVVDILITAQDIIVDNSSYPTVQIGETAHNFRELGLGYANLGALLMSMGLPYDSPEGRDAAAAITALMTGEAYVQSSRLADVMGPFEGFDSNKDAMRSVIAKHAIAAEHLPATNLADAARHVWHKLVLPDIHFRNSQATVIAPTGTIAFMMDCDTTGIEPDIALVKYKSLVGGGQLKIVNQSIERALVKLNYPSTHINEILRHIRETGTIEGSTLLPQHLAIFDCAFKPQYGSRSIPYMGHIKMMAAVQPFISGAISKTVNLPESSTVEDIERAYIEAWNLKLKSIAVYRDGSKKVQPLSTKLGQLGQGPAGEDQRREDRAQTREDSAGDRPGNERKGSGGENTSDETFHTYVAPSNGRRRLPLEHKSITHRFDIANFSGHLIAGEYPDGTLGEIFVNISKQGSTMAGLMNAFATVVSYALQHGVPLGFLVDKLSNTQFEPSGFTKNLDVPYAKSIIDYIMKWLDKKYVTIQPTLQETSAAPTHTRTVTTKDTTLSGTSLESPVCPKCGHLMTVNGSCHRCLNCGATSGCS